MTLTAAHRELIRLLAAEAVDHYLEEHHNLLQTEEEPMRDTHKGESPHVHTRPTATASR
jgi:hypothetical protein